MITAKPANNYNLDMVAIPGKITGLKSKGYKTFNHGKKAALVTSANEIPDMMHWLS